MRTVRIDGHRHRGRAQSVRKVVQLSAVFVALSLITACGGGEVVVLGSGQSEDATQGAESPSGASQSSKSASFAPDSEMTSDEPQSGQRSDKPDSYYLDRILQYCDERSPGLCFAECETVASNPGLNAISLMLADVNVDMMVMYGNISSDEADKFRPYWVKFWERYCP
jgi:hypothetical protein